MQLELALHKLHCEVNSEEILLWGKINGKYSFITPIIFSYFYSGLKNDYFVAVGLTYTDQFEFPTKRFYYCLSNDYQFIEMPDLNDQHKEYIDRDYSFFTGEPQRKLK